MYEIISTKKATLLGTVSSSNIIFLEQEWEGRRRERREEIRELHANSPIFLAKWAIWIEIEEIVLYYNILSGTKFRT